MAQSWIRSIADPSAAQAKSVASSQNQVPGSQTNQVVLLEPQVSVA